MNECIFEMNNVLADWKSRFDISNNVQMTFAESANGIITFNGKPICPGEDLVLESANYDAEQITYFFEEKKVIGITVIWPEDMGPVISSIIFGYYKV